jgi:hydrogenase-4 component B
MSLPCILAGAALAGLSGVPALLAGRVSDRAQWVSAALSVAGSLLGLAGVALALTGPAEGAARSAWLGAAMGLDALSAFFLAPVFLVSGLGAVYGLGYWPQSEQPHTGRGLRLFFGLLTAAMVLVVVARNSVLFLVAWEVMALSAFFLIAAEEEEPGARQAAWVYLVATHIGTAALMAMFLLLRAASGTFAWEPLEPGLIGGAQAAALFLLALVGFGMKAGVMPFHFWLPSAHAWAPSHVSALLSGVMIKMGLYGILRMAGYLPLPSLAWGAGLVVAGGVAGVMGIAAAGAQADLKRLLAYSSIENVGIMLAGIGLALLGRALGHPVWIVLGLGGALLHLLNHSLFKPLLFFSAGALLRATGTRRLDELGGLARALPVTAAGFLAGAWAGSALPGLNGFVGELLLYLGFFHAALGGAAVPALLAALAAAALALTGALALATFARAFGTIFLGTPRSGRAPALHAIGPAMKGVLLLLAGLCAAVAAAPWALAPALDRAIAAWSDGPPGGLPALVSVAPLWAVGWAALGIWTAAAGLLALLWRRPANRPATAMVGTWDCGYAAATSPRLQYTASSGGDGLAGLFGWAIARTAHRPARADAFPGPARLALVLEERLLSAVLWPFFLRWADRFMRLRVLQQGQAHIYLVYILVMFVLGIAWAVLGAGGGP